ncbi:hypothetical protein [Nostoc sp.]
MSDEKIALAQPSKMSDRITFLYSPYKSLKDEAIARLSNLLPERIA